MEISDMIVGYLGYEFTIRYSSIPLLQQYIAKLSPGLERAYSLNSYKYLHFDDPSRRLLIPVETKWELDGKLHRYDGPAIMEFHSNGNRKLEIYYQHGLIHRPIGPAYITYHENGQVHRCWWGTGGCSYRAGAQPTFEEYDDANNLVKFATY